MPERRRKFTHEFKDEAVKMVIETARPTAEVARDIHVKRRHFRELGEHVPGRARGGRTAVERSNPSGSLEQSPTLALSRATRFCPVADMRPAR
jgi:transposase-like protein